MNKKFVLLITIILTLISCGLQKIIDSVAQNKSHRDEAPALVNEEGVAKNPISNPDNQSAPAEQPVQAEPSPVAQDPVQPAEPPRLYSDDFRKVDDNGVIIVKKNGVQVTKMPNGEQLILPEQI